MSNVKRIDSNARMSKTVIHNGTAYLAGQVATDFGADIQTQTSQVLGKIEDLLSAAGSSKDGLLSAIIYIRDMSDFAAMNEVWDAWVPEGGAPARACVSAPMAHPDIRVEISIIAAA
jgi:enamine deaminase RidA (YjgF/YER057c/UK114 family)